MGKKKQLGIYNIDEFGQVFTPENIVDRMITLIKNNGKILEPSTGDGSFFKKFDDNITGIEIDNKFCPVGCLNMDFFDFNVLNKFDTIIGNPPYVAYKNINKNTIEKIKNDLFDNRSNLYLFFIHKCYLHLEDNGEIIFITPPDFLKSTSSIKLNNLLFENGTITHYYEYNDVTIFKNFSPNVAIWRYQKNNFDRKTLTNEGEKIFENLNGQLIFTNSVYDLNFKDLFYVKVGAVSGADKYFTNEKGNKDFVCSYTNKDGKLKRMFYNIESEELLQYKDILINRKMKNFTEKNWFIWGRDYYKSDENRIYLNCKTRNISPFFMNDSKDYDGSVLAIFPKNKMIDLEKCMKIFNEEINWFELGFKKGGRYIFSQKSLENIKLPSSLFKDIIKKDDI
jgi:adenine-specific DNA-methyltransferase